MASGNYVCDIDQKQASAFCFRGDRKMLLCDEHVSSTLNKGYEVFAIAAIDYMETIADYVPYKESVDVANRGLECVEVYLEATAKECEMALAQLTNLKNSLLQVVEETCNRVEQQLNDLYQLRKSEFESLAKELLQHKQTKGAPLSQAAKTLSQPIIFPPPVLEFIPLLSEFEFSRNIFNSLKLAHRDQKLSELLISRCTQGTDLREQVQTIEKLKNLGTFTGLKEANFLCNHFLRILDTLPDDQKPIHLKTKTTLQNFAYVVHTEFLKQELELTDLLRSSRSQESIKSLALDFSRESQAALNSQNLSLAYELATQASTLLCEHLPNHPETVEALLQVALVLKHQKQLNKSESTLKTALKMSLEIDSNSLETAKCNRRMGDIYDDMGNVEKAENCYNLAISTYGIQAPTHPDTCKAYINLGIFYENSNRLEEAIVAWTQALSIAELNNDQVQTELIQGYLKDAIQKTETKK